MRPNQYAGKNPREEVRRAKMSTGKFDSQATESLYRQEPDDSHGASLDGFSWYGLYRANEQGGGSIVIEDTYGFVGRVDFETTAALELAWCEVTTDEATDYYAVGF